MWLQTLYDVATQSDPTPPVKLLVMYDASGNHDVEYFRKLRRLVQVNYAKSTRIHAYIAQSKDDDKRRCPSKFRRKVKRAIGRRLEELHFFCYKADSRFEKCTGKFDVYYLDSTTLTQIHRDIVRIKAAYPGTMLLLRRMSDIRNVFDISNRNAPESRLEKLVTSLLIHDHVKSIPLDNFNQEDTTQHRMSKDDKCSVIIFNNQLH